MSNTVKWLMLMVGLNFSAVAQIIPEPGAKLNYTQVMFEYEKIKDAGSYLLQIVPDTLNPDFKKPLIEQRDASTATLINNLQFGKKYLWRYAGIVKGVQQTWKGPYKFETTDINLSGRNSFAVTVLKNDTAKNAGGLIATDYYTIFNRKGEPVWYLPQMKERTRPISVLRDLRLTSSNTVTFLADLFNADAYECDLQGRVLWKAPDDGKLSGDTTEYYHHNFQRLPNGNYMVLGNKYVWKKVPPLYIDLANRSDSFPGAIRIPDTLRVGNANKKLINGELFAKVPFGTIIEYNPKGEIVWSWNSETYLKDDEIFPLLFTISILPGMAPALSGNDKDAHLNAFSVDAKNEFVYAGFRQINRLIKIEKLTGKVVSTWDSTTLSDPEAFFYHQHGANVMSDGSVLVFDNGDIRLKDKASRVLVLTPPADKLPAEVALSFDCKFDSIVRCQNKLDKTGHNLM